MSTYPLSTQQTDQGDDVQSHNLHSHDQSESTTLGTEHPLTADPDTLADLAGQLRLVLSPDSQWFGQGDLNLVGTHPISAGGFADVWVGEVGGRKVAVKSYKCYTSANCMPTYRRFRHEALVYSCLSDEFVVPFIGVYSTWDHPFALVFELMGRLNLGGNGRCVGKLELLLEVARAVTYLHSVNVIHGNIKIANILIGADGRVRVTGLGAASISSKVSGTELDRFFHGAAPELADPQRFGLTDAGATPATDVYAFGVLAWQVFADRTPFSDKGMVAGVVLMLEGHRPGRPDHPELSDHVWKAIRGCWKINPAQRKTMTEVVAVLEAELSAHKSQRHISFPL